MKSFLSKCLIKGAGAITVGLIGYDAYKRGCWKSKMDTKLLTADMVQHVHNTSQLLDMNSQVRSDAKNGFHQWFLGTKIPTFITSIAGFVKGALTSMADNVVPLALATGALMFKGGMSKFCGIGLGLYAAHFFLTELCGIGKPDYLPDKV